MLRRVTVVTPSRTAPGPPLSCTAHVKACGGRASAKCPPALMSPQAVRRLQPSGTGGPCHRPWRPPPGARRCSPRACTRFRAPRDEGRATWGCLVLGPRAGMACTARRACAHPPAARRAPRVGGLRCFWGFDSPGGSFPFWPRAFVESARPPPPASGLRASHASVPPGHSAPGSRTAAQQDLQPTTPKACWRAAPCVVVPCMRVLFGAPNPHPTAGDEYPGPPPHAWTIAVWLGTAAHGVRPLPIAVLGVTYARDAREEL